MNNNKFFRVIVDCGDSQGFRSYGTYVGFSYQEVKSLLGGLPTGWRYLID